MPTKVITITIEGDDIESVEPIFTQYSVDDIPNFSIELNVTGTNPDSTINAQISVDGQPLEGRRFAPTDESYHNDGLPLEGEVSS